MARSAPESRCGGDLRRSRRPRPNSMACRAAARPEPLRRRRGCAAARPASPPRPPADRHGRSAACADTTLPTLARRIASKSTASMSLSGCITCFTVSSLRVRPCACISLIGLLPWRSDSVTMPSTQGMSLMTNSMRTPLSRMRCSAASSEACGPMQAARTLHEIGHDGGRRAVQRHAGRLGRHGLSDAGAFGETVSRQRGMCHGESPFLVAGDASCDRTGRTH
jgi:hypothetical protein